MANVDDLLHNFEPLRVAVLAALGRVKNAPVHDDMNAAGSGYQHANRHSHVEFRVAGLEPSRRQSTR